MQFLAPIFVSLLISIRTALSTPLTDVVPGPSASLEPVPSTWVPTPPSTVGTPKFLSHISGLLGPKTNTSKASLAVKLDVSSLADSYVICGGAACDGECIAYALTEILPETCYISPEYQTAYIYQPSNVGLPYMIFAADAISGIGCIDGLGLPAVNTCYSTPDENGFFSN